MEGKMSLYYQKQQSFLSPRSPFFFSVKMISATSLFVFFFFFFFARSTQADSWQMISRWPHHLSCNFLGEKTIRWMLCIMFFFPLFPSLDFTLKSLIGLRKGLVSRWNSDFVHAWKLSRLSRRPETSSNLSDLDLSCFCILARCRDSVL